MTEKSHLGTGRQPMEFELSNNRAELLGIYLDINRILLEWDNPQDQYNETNVMHFSFSLLRIKGTVAVLQPCHS
jgi:hypothetical protein